VSDPFSEIVPGVLVATGVLYTTTTTVITGPGGSCLVIDPAVTAVEIAGLAAALAARGLRPVLGWSTHPHWDHVLWHASLGDVPRYATPAAAAAARNERDMLAAAAGKSAPGHDSSLIAKVTPLPGTSIPWDGPTAELIVHDGHATGHGAVFLPDSGVLIAGDMCSDIEMPFVVDPGQPEAVMDQLRDYRAGLSRLAAVAGVRQVVPGHGHVGDAAELRRRVGADFEYLDLLERGQSSGDPRISGYARAFHQTQLRYFRR
jgi:glyoxylase-like metal-dependent hydrolase (beta-lactamase superfamily II)